MEYGPKFLRIYNRLMYIEHRAVIPCSSRIWFLLFPKSNALLKGCCHSAIPPYIVKFHTKSEKKKQCSQKVPYIKKDMLGYVIAYGSRSRRDIFDISQCSQTILTKTPKTYTLILRTSEVILASSLILIVFIHPYFL
jgi:hypothetical protein